MKITRDIIGFYLNSVLVKRTTLYLPHIPGGVVNMIVQQEESYPTRTVRSSDLMIPNAELPRLAMHDWTRIDQWTSLV